MLAINTAFMQANLALDDGKKVFYANLDAQCKHSEQVLSAIDSLCDQAKVNISDVKTLAVVVGPGSFTGLRIGVAIAKALACANQDVSLVPLTSLDLMAYIVVKHENVGCDFVCAINALSGMYFVAKYDASGQKIVAEKMIDQSQFDAIKEPIFVLKGDLANCHEIEISAEDLYEFAKTQKKTVPLCDFKPLYLRLSQAEADLIKKNKKDNKNS